MGMMERGGGGRRGGIGWMGEAAGWGGELVGEWVGGG